jgi:hypothetical protein
MMLKIRIGFLNQLSHFSSDLQWKFFLLSLSQDDANDIMPFEDILSKPEYKLNELLKNDKLIHVILNNVWKVC